MKITKIIDLTTVEQADLLAEVKLAEDKTTPVYKRGGEFDWSSDEVAAAIKRVKDSPAFENILKLGYTYGSTRRQELNGTLIFNDPKLKKKVAYVDRMWKARTEGKPVSSISAEANEPMQYGIFATGYLRKLRATGSQPAQNIAVKEVEYDHAYDMYKSLMRDLLQHLKRVKARMKDEPEVKVEESVEVKLYNLLLAEGTLHVGSNKKMADDFEAYLKKNNIKYKRKDGEFEFMESKLMEADIRKTPEYDLLRYNCFWGKGDEESEAVIEKRAKDIIESHKKGKGGDERVKKMDIASPTFKEALAVAISDAAADRG